eukprot:CAMPEP_0185732434 /NCGR_PEP_ID=MMETSP1171-20130828/16187_1 /TAXON_ID=374046 /ORGANISM="Helicotheca tamensis, Strain CCMP826" /LENGTH=380 /DNA_ID=CAMNT_0028401931 /DNA_START=32 /DNA_END=1174 /DNA_ORIENTATION=+
MEPSIRRNKREWWEIEIDIPDPKLHSLLNFNPEIEDDRRKFDGKAVIEVVERAPHAARARYNFKGCYDNCFPLHMAVMLGASTSVVKALLRAHPSAITGRDRYQSTPFHCASEFGASIEVMSLLLEKFPGAIKEGDHNHNTPLNSACKYRPTPEMISFLIKTHPDSIWVINNVGMTPLHSACTCQASIEVVSQLLQAWPAAAREKDSNGMTPLHVACEYEAPSEVISLLIREYPKAAKGGDGHGRTPLQSACWNNASEEVIKLLIEEKPSAVKDNDFFMGSLQDYDFENEKTAKLVSNVCRLFCDKVDNETAEGIMKYFIDIEWWGGALIVVDVRPTILNALEIHDKLVACLFSKVKRHCKLLTLWQLIMNRQDIITGAI